MQDEINDTRVYDRHKVQRDMNVYACPRKVPGGALKLPFKMDNKLLLGIVDSL
jgi:hypothetical protein